VRLEKFYQLRIELQDVEPSVWRSVRVPATITLAKLHKVFQVVMGWEDSHLHEFRIGAMRYGIPDPDFQEEQPVIAEKRAVLQEILKPSITRFLYLYDFGDGWEHEVTIKRTGALGVDERPLLCLAGANACPPDDVGGPDGYADFLKAITNPKHKEHQHYLQWCGGAFDPKGFDLQSVNRSLARVRL
jgi:hypothetical protein